MHDSPNGEVVSGDYLYRAEMLAYAIPSESYAVGANPLSIATENVDMAGEYQNGRDDYPDDEKKWGHSYFIQRPLKRVHEMFGKIVNEIGGTIND